MAKGQVRNAIPMPGVTWTDPVGEDQILYSTANLVKVGFTFAKDTTAGPKSDGILPMGTVVSPSGKKAAEYVNDDEGVNNLLGVLLDEINIAESDQLANVALGGEFNADKIKGMDATAMDALGAVEVTLPGGKKIIRF